MEDAGVAGGHMTTEEIGFIAEMERRVASGATFREAAESSGSSWGDALWVADHSDKLRAALETYVDWLESG